MKSILRFLGLDVDENAETGDSAETETVRKITAKLDQLPPEAARFMAAFAYILGRVANADLEIDPEETAMMEKILVEYGKIPREQAIIVIQMAKSQNRLLGGTEDYLVTREFNKIATRDQKLALLRCLFAVSAADQSVSVVEDNEIRRISKELLLDHSDFIEVRRSFREYLAVLKKPES